jgi:hypothetical protein
MSEIAATLIPMNVFPPEERELFVSWASQRKELTQFDKDVIGYPRTVIARATEDGKPILYIPVHPILMGESLLSDPDLTKSQIAHGLLTIMAELDGVMKLTGMHEVYFVTTDDHFAGKAIEVGFTEVKGHVLKRKLPNVT